MLNSELSPILFIVVVVTVITELIFLSRFNPDYWRKGIQIYHKNFRGLALKENPPNLKAVETQLRSWLLGSFLFRQIAPYEYAFREKLLDFSLVSYSPIMRGVVKIEPATGFVSVIGFLNWFPLVFTLVILILFWRHPFFMKVVQGILLVIVVLYLLQYFRFDQVGRAVARSS